VLAREPPGRCQLYWAWSRHVSRRPGGVSRNLNSKPATFGPDKESWDFDGNRQDFGEQKNPLKPHANP
jgi:hypothetical protein